MSANRELAVLRRYRRKIDRARLEGGTLSDDFYNDADPASLERAARRWYVEAIARVGPRSGVESVLLSLENRRLPQVVFSDYYAEAKLESLGLSKYFAAVYVGERLGAVKPNCKVLLKIAADFSVPVENILHIGDRSDRDEAVAQAVGCRCLILGRDFRDFGSLRETLET